MKHKPVQFEQTTAVELVTPAMAKAFLSNQVASQRPPQPGKIREFVELIRTGRFRLTHQGLAFTPAGQLMDGQNRCHAIVLTGTPLRLNVSRNVPFEAMDGIDAGKARSLAYRAGLGPVEVSVARALINIVDSRAIPTTHLLRQVNDRTGDAVAELMANAPSNRRGVTNAYVRAGAVLRMAYPGADYVVAQYRAMANAAFTDMARGTGELYRQLTEGVTHVNKLSFVDIAARTWLVLDPTKADLKRLMVRSRADLHQLLRAEIIKQIPELTQASAVSTP